MNLPLSIRDRCVSALGYSVLRIGCNRLAPIAPASSLLPVQSPLSRHTRVMWVHCACRAILLRRCLRTNTFQTSSLLFARANAVVAELVA